MKALQVTAPGESRIVELPLPEPGPGQVRVRVIACNTCPQWDLHLAANEPMFVGHRFEYPYPPGQPGHEMVGEIEAVGEGVTLFTPGQRVAAWRDQGHRRAGCYAQAVIFEADNLLAVPADLEPAQIASLELAMCVSVSALELRSMDAIAGRRAVVNGLGPAGLIAAQLLRAEGADGVAGFETSAARREYALERGIVDAAYDPRDPAISEAAPLRRSVGAFEVAIDCVGFPEAVRFLMDRVTRHVALFAVQRHDYTYALGHAGLTLVGYRGHRKEAAEYALAQILAGRLDLRPLVSVELPLERYQEGVALLRRQEALKVCYRPPE